MIKYLCSKQGLGLKAPQIILSITGGAQNFSIPHQMKKAFKQGLAKAAGSTGAWIITGGTNAGVMKLVGEAVADHKSKVNITTIGIATWGKVYLRKQLVINEDADKKSNFVLNFKENSALIPCPVDKFIVIS